MKTYNFGYNTFEQVVDRVNIGAVQGFEHHTSEFLAASYAYEAAIEVSDSIGSIDADTIEAHLDFLREAGAQFDTKQAIKIGLEFVAQSK